MERAGAKRRLHNFQDSLRVKSGKVLGTVAEAFELATELLNQDASTDTDPSIRLILMKCTPTTAQAEANKAQCQLTLLQQKYDPLEGDFNKVLKKVRKNWKTLRGVWRDKAVTADNALGKIRLTETERVETFNKIFLN